MSFTERLPLSTKLMPKADICSPSRLHLIPHGQDTYWESKHVHSIFLSFRPSTTWEQAEELERLLDTVVDRFCIHYIPAGEDG